MIKQYLFIIILLCALHVKAHAQNTPKLMGIVKLPSGSLNSKYKFHVKNNTLLFILNTQLYYYKLSNEDSVITYVDFGRIPININEIIFDVSLINDSSFYLLTNKYLYSFNIDFTTKSVSNSPNILYRQENQLYIDIYQLKNKEDVLLGVNFTGFPEKDPKINIKSLEGSKSYHHFVPCDPYNVYLRNKLVASNGIGTFIVQSDNLKNDFHVLDSTLKVIHTFNYFDSSVFDSKLGNEVCAQAQKYRALGTEEEYDNLITKIDQFPHIDKMVFLDDTTLLIMGYFTKNGQSKLLFSKLYFNASFTQLLKTEPIRLTFNYKTLDHRYQKENTPINPFGKLTRCDGGKIYYIDWIVDTTKVVSNDDYQKAILLPSNQTKIGIYIFK